MIASKAVQSFLTLGGLIQRHAGMPLYVCSPRKAGTHLISAVLVDLGLRCLSHVATEDEKTPTSAALSTDCSSSSRRRSFVLSHHAPRRVFAGLLQEGKAHCILNIRDPRAIFLACLDYLDWRVPLPSPNWHGVQFYRESLKAFFGTREALAWALLDCDPVFKNGPYDLEFQLGKLLIWHGHPGVLKVRYEDLVAGEKADGSCPVDDICRYVGLPRAVESASMLSRLTRGTSPSKNVGASDRWKAILPPALLDAFMARHGRLVASFGYQAVECQASPT
jgi:hypothetical protein